MKCISIKESKMAVHTGYESRKKGKYLLSVVIAFAMTAHSWAQREIVPTVSLFISGMITHSMSFSYSEIMAMPSKSLDDVIILNHKGETKDTLTSLKGIPLKSILSSIEIHVERPRFLNEFYFVFVASDNYKVVFSWNEIYNTPIGDQIYIITEMKGRKGEELEERIAFLSTGDRIAGRRFVKGFQRIEIRRAD